MEAERQKGERNKGATHRSGGGRGVWYPTPEILCVFPLLYMVIRYCLVFLATFGFRISLLRSFLGFTIIVMFSERTSNLAGVLLVC